MNRRISAFTGFMIVFAAFLLHMAAALSGMHGFALADNKEATKCVYLTFDDGPSDKVTPKILDVLDEENVKATFFIIGKQAETRRNIIEREFNSGHTVAVHSYSHAYGEIYSSPAALLQDIDKCNDVIQSICGTRSNVYRFPGGSYGLKESLIRAVTDRGMRYVDWNASLCDAEIVNPSPESLFKAAVNTSSDRHNIVLLAHDSTTKTPTALALKSIIGYYKENGYSFATF